MKLELGSGANPTPGFVHLDARASAPGVDIVGLAYPLPPEITAESVDEIRAVDVLEHIQYRETDAALADWARVLKPGGRLFVQVPDAEQIMAWFIHEPGKLVERIPEGLPKTPMMGAQWRLMGGGADGVQVTDPTEADWNLHRSMWSRSSLTDALYRAGFVVESFVTNPHPNCQVWAVKG